MFSIQNRIVAVKLANCYCFVQLNLEWSRNIIYTPSVSIKTTTVFKDFIFLRRLLLFNDEAMEENADGILV